MVGRVSVEDADRLARCAVVFEAADPPRAGAMAFYDPDGVGLPEGVGTSGEVTLAVRDDDTHPRTVPAVRLTVGDAVPVLGRARRGHQGHPAATFWGAATVVALQLVAAGRILPGVSAGHHDAWRVGPLEAEDVMRIRTLADAMPAPARAVPLPDRTPLELPDAESLLRGFLDAVADGMPRSAGPSAVGSLSSPALAAPGRIERTPERVDRWADTELPFAEDRPVRVPHLRAWANDVAARVDSGVRISLRVDVPEPEGVIWGTAAPPLPGEDYPEEGPAFSAVVQVHAMSERALVADAADLWDDDAQHGEWGIGIPRRGPGTFGPRARTDAMLAVRRAAHAWPPLKRLLERPVPDRIDLDDTELEELLHTGTAKLGAVGVDVHWPKGLVRDLTARVSVGGASAAPSDMPAIFGGDVLFTFDWQLALGGEPLTEAEMDALAGAHRPLVKLRDQWVLVDPELARRARSRKVASVTAIEALTAALTGTAQVLTEEGERAVEVAPAPWLDALRARIADPDDGTDPIAAPPALHASLRDYQLRGLRWLVRMTSLGLGGCLADDMGLGKTVTLIALHLHRQLDAATAGPTLVVCPASLLGNWEREIERFAPGEPVRRFHGTGRTLDGLAGGFVLTTYGTMRLDVAPRRPAAASAETETETEAAPEAAGTAETADAAEQRPRAGALLGTAWGLVVADEAQHVKNARSGTAKALRELPSGARVALTGTPVENNLSELWAVLDWTTPGLLGGLPRFRARWARPIEAYQNEETAADLARLVRPFLLRRRKSDPGIAPELPPKTETDRPVGLTREQAGLYQAVVRETMARIEQAEGIERRGLVLSLLTSLKQVCNHPAQYLKELPGAPSTRTAGRSGKLELLDELLDVIGSEGGATLVFTQYVAMAKLLERHLSQRGVLTQLLHGGTPVRRREEMVDRFQSGDAPVFLLSLKAAGTGLNLTRAEHVIHYDRWWNPAVEEQATDRAYRIGQTRPVQVHRLIAEGTVEDRIAEALAGKRALADAVLAGGEAALTELSDADLADLVTLRGSR